MITLHGLYKALLFAELMVGHLRHAGQSWELPAIALIDLAI